MRIVNEASRTRFRLSLEVVDWDDVLISTDAQGAFDAFYSRIMTEYDRCFPVQRIRLRGEKPHPWMTDEL